MLPFELTAAAITAQFGGVLRISDGLDEELEGLGGGWRILM